MKLKKISKSKMSKMPQVDKEIIKGYYRHNVIDPLIGHNNIGIELGVAQGIFSKRMVESGKFLHFFGVDMYSDTHDVGEYKDTLKTIGLLKNYKLIRMTFDEALDLFEDNFFDFIYIDGFAHTGEEGGETLAKWYKKLKVGGIFAGDDYHSDWPLVIWAVNDFVNQTNSSLMLTDKVENLPFCEYPSWFIKKNTDHNTQFTVSQTLKKMSESEKNRIGRKRKWRVRIRKIERYIKSYIKK